MIRALAAYRLYVIGRFWPLFLVSLSGWLGLILLDCTVDIPVLCTSGRDGLSDVAARLAAIWSSNGWAVLLSSWLLMLAAMMAPLLAAPLMHVWDRSLAERRLRAALLFVFAYAALWMFALGLLQAAALVLRVVAGQEILALAVAAGLALCWQRASIRRRLLRECHIHRALPAFGVAADLGSLRFGMAVAVPCIGACGLLMLVPLASPAAHLPLMAAISIFILAERFG